LNEAGQFHRRDCILYRMGPNSGWWCMAAARAMSTLTKYVVGRNAAMMVDDDLHDLSLQGPGGGRFLAKHVPGIRDLKYFHHVPATLFGRPVTISRTGYTGERGYEIFCKAEDAGLIWGYLCLSEGKALGIIPACFTDSGLACESKVPCFSIPTTVSQMYPFDNDPPGQSLGARSRLYGESGQERLQRRRRACALEGQGTLQDFGILVEGKAPAGHGRSRLLPATEEVGVVTFAIGVDLDRQVDGHRTARCARRCPWKQVVGFVGRTSRVRRLRIPCPSTM